jgi:putative transposase
MTLRDIQSHLKDMYDVEVSAELISQVTDSVFEEVRVWHSCALESIYPIVYLDALRLNSREGGKSQNKSLYLALGVNLDGMKEFLGFYLAETEGSKFWMGVLSDLKNREIQDIFISRFEE